MQKALNSIYIFVLLSIFTILLLSCNYSSTEDSDENTIDLCRDGIDNDEDGATDCNDPECRKFNFCQNDASTADGGSSTDSDGDSDTDSDSDSDVDADTDADADPDGLYYWHTFFGADDTGDGPGIDTGENITADDNNNLFITGYSEYHWKGPSDQDPLNNGEGGMFALKLDSSGRYIWHTFYGRAVWSNEDRGNCIRLDNNNDIYIAGYSNNSWNGPGNQAPLNEHSVKNDFQNHDLMVLKLDSDGEYIWHTFYGTVIPTNCGDMYVDNADDEGFGISFDNDLNVYVAGRSVDSWQGPSGEKPLAAFKPEGCNGTNVFILKLDSAGNYEWHTFVGLADPGSESDIRIDDEDNIYVTGTSPESWKGPQGQDPFHDTGYGGVFVAKYNADGVYEWHSFWGSSSSDSGGMAIDKDNNVYLTGYSVISWEGPSGRDPLHDLSYNQGNARDTFILKLNSDGVYQWHTFYGSFKSDSGKGIVVDSLENIYIAGFCEDPWDDALSYDPVDKYTGYRDIFILKLKSTGEYDWHSFYGSIHADIALGIDLILDDYIFITGLSHSSWNGPSGQPPLNKHSEDGDTNDDIFILKLGTDI